MQSFLKSGKISKNAPSTSSGLSSKTERVKLPQPWVEK